MAKNKIITSQGNVQFINSKGKTISMHPMHCYAVYQDDTVSFLFIYMKEYSGQAFFASQFEDLEVDGETYDSIDALKEAIAEAFAKAGAQARTEIVDELPETGYTNTIYLLPKEHGEGYDEYVYNEEKGWQLIGDTDIEFERYLQKVDFNAYSADTKEKIDFISGAVDDNASDIQFISGAVDTEISNRETADAVISGAVDTLSTNLANEVQRAQNAEQTLQNNINTVNSRVDAEQIARANADNALSGAIDSVVSDLASEVSRAEGVETALSGAIDTEISAREAADAVISGAVDSLSANLSLEVQRAQNAEDALNSKVNAISGAVDTMGDEAIVGAEYVSSSTTIDFYNASGDVVAQVDATDFIKDGMIDDVRIENGNLVIDFNTASGKQDISIPLTDIFNPANYYDKTAVDGFISDLEAADSVISGAVDNVSANLATEVQRAQNAEGALSGAIDTKLAISDFNTYSASVETELSSKADLSALTEDERVWGEALNDLNSRINTVSGDVADKASQSAVDALNGVVTAHTANTDVHVTSTEKATWNGKQDALVAGENITISGNVISATGGGSTYTAGRGISIANDTISFSLPIYDRSSGSISECHEENGNVPSCSSNFCHLEQPNGGIGSRSNSSHKEGLNTRIGDYCTSSHVEGYYSQINTDSPYSHAEGYYTEINNPREHASGSYNVSNITSSTFGNSGNTLFSVGNGTANNARHNAFEIRQNGDIYLSSGGTDIKLQDHLGGGGSSVNVVQTTGTSTTDVMSQDAVTTQLNNKANKTAAFGGYKFGSYNNADYIQYTNVNNDNIGKSIYYPKINGKGIFTNNSTYAQNNYNFQLVETSAITTAITSSSTDAQVPSAKAVNDKLGGLSLVKLTQAEYDALVTKDSNTLYIISD